MNRDNWTKQELETYYRDFEKNLGNYLDKLKRNLSIDEITFSIEEIEDVGKFYKKLVIKYGYENIPIKNPLEIFIAYFGQAWIKYFGGKWYFSYNKKDSSLGYPQIINWGPPEFPWSAIRPIVWYQYLIIEDFQDLSQPFKSKIRDFNLDK